MNIGMPSQGIPPAAGAVKPIGQVAITGKTPSATAMMPNTTSIKPTKSDFKWRPFRDKVAKRSSPFYSMGF